MESGADKAKKKNFCLLIFLTITCSSRVDMQGSPARYNVNFDTVGLVGLLLGCDAAEEVKLLSLICNQTKKKKKNRHAKMTR